jgi:hypothetical protein
VRLKQPQRGAVGVRGRDAQRHQRRDLLGEARDGEKVDADHHRLQESMLVREPRREKERRQADRGQDRRCGFRPLRPGEIEAVAADQLGLVGGEVVRRLADRGRPSSPRRQGAEQPELERDEAGDVGPRDRGVEEGPAGEDQDRGGGEPPDQSASR